MVGTDVFEDGSWILRVECCGCVEEVLGCLHVFDYGVSGAGPVVFLLMLGVVE